jgi:hypothetical protein
MWITITGAKLFLDVEDAQLAADDGRMRLKPILLSSMAARTTTTRNCTRSGHDPMRI